MDANMHDTGGFGSIKYIIDIDVARSGQVTVASLVDGRRVDDLMRSVVFTP